MATLLELPQELFPLIASHLPLQRLPATLCSLALTCIRIHSQVHSVLYRRVVINNEDHALELLPRISNDANLGPLIRELHLRIDPSNTRSDREDTTTVLLKLQEVIEKGSLSLLKYFRLVVVKFGISFTEKYYPRYSLHIGFLPSLNTFCPNIKGICLDCVGNFITQPQAGGPEVFDLKGFQGLTVASLKFYRFFHLGESPENLSRTIISLASSLRSLTLFFDEPRLKDPGLILSITFPQLEAIHLSGFQLKKTSDAMDFWIRHPRLERVFVDSTQTLWFSEKQIDGKFLPNLTHLGTRFRDVVTLAKVIDFNQLEHLCINASWNCQIPYLLRAAIPSGLPNLKSLEIHQNPDDSDNTLFQDGAKWQETEDGEFIEAEFHLAWKEIDESYMLSILKGAPNIQELCINDFPRRVNDSEDARFRTSIFKVIGQFRRLQRFYYPYTHGDLSYQELRRRKQKPTSTKGFKEDCRLLGNLSRSLQSITDTKYTTHGPYLVGNIVRNDEGSMVDVLFDQGFGMEFTGGDDDPFPLNMPRQGTYDD